MNGSSPSSSCSSASAIDFAILLFPARDALEHAFAMHTIPALLSRFGPAEIGMVAPADASVNAFKAYSHAEICRLLASWRVPVLQHVTFRGDATVEAVEKRCCRLRDELRVTGAFAMKGWDRIVVTEGAPAAVGSRTIAAAAGGSAAAVSPPPAASASSPPVPPMPPAVSPAAADVFPTTASFVEFLQGRFDKVVATTYIEGHHLRRRPVPSGVLSSAWWAVDAVDGQRIGIPVAELLAGIDVDIAKASAGATALIANMVYCHELFFAFRALAAERGLQVPIVPEVYVGNTAAEFRKRYKNEGFYAPDALRRAIEAAGDDHQVQLLWVAHMVRQVRAFIAGGVTCIYVSAPQGRAAELFLTQCQLEGLLKKSRAHAPPSELPHRTQSAPSRLALAVEPVSLHPAPHLNQHFFLSSFSDSSCTGGSGGGGGGAVETSERGSTQGGAGGGTGGVPAGTHATGTTGVKSALWRYETK